VFKQRLYSISFEKKMEHRMKIVIFGTGGVGGYFGGRLALLGEDVTFLARGAHLAAIRESGLRVESAEGNFTVQPAKATDSAHSIGEADLILLATKAWQLDEAISQMKPLIGQETVILPLLNGMEHMDRLIETFGTGHVIGGLCRISVFIAAPGIIRHVGVKPYIAYGEWDNSQSERIQRIHKLFSSIPGIVAENPADIQRACGRSSSSSPARAESGPSPARRSENIEPIPNPEPC
jgi:2-dehydropantoate 2-reductase